MRLLHLHVAEVSDGLIVERPFAVAVAVTGIAAVRCESIGQIRSGQAGHTPVHATAALRRSGHAAGGCRPRTGARGASPSGSRSPPGDGAANPASPLPSQHRILRRHHQGAVAPRGRRVTLSLPPARRGGPAPPVQAPPRRDPPSLMGVMRASAGRAASGSRFPARRTEGAGPPRRAGGSRGTTAVNSRSGRPYPIAIGSNCSWWSCARCRAAARLAGIRRTREIGHPGLVDGPGRLLWPGHIFSIAFP
jgi:hypothetical protein